MANRLCPLCGATFVEWATTCVDCGVELVDPDDNEDPRSLAEEDQLVYELAGWTLDQRTEVAQVMAESGISHAWDGDELYVHVRYETAVDRLLAPIEHPDGDPDGDDDDVIDAVVDELPVPQEPLTEYDLAEWTPAARQMVAAQLASAGIAFGWDESLLLVSVEDEEAVDDLLDDLEDSGALDEADETDTVGTETPGAVLEMLFLSADRLRKDALDVDGLRDLSTALALSNPTHPPYGVDPIMWHRIMGLAEELAAAETGDLGDGGEAEGTGGSSDADDDADEELAREIAAELRELLRSFV